MNEMRFSDVCGFTDKQWQATHAALEHRFTLFGGYRGPGKALALDTPIPTPAGWSTMGALKVGDSVFGADGLPCNVVGVSEIFTQRPCYRVRFDDGAEIVADENHEWLTFDKRERVTISRQSEEWRARRRANRPSRGTGKRPYLAEMNSARAELKAPMPAGTIRTTKEIADTLKTKDGREVNHTIQLAKPLALPHADLPIAPYLLGLWLGDGTSVAGQITTADKEVIEAFEACGYTVKKYKAEYLWGIEGFKAQLRSLNLIGNKHVPAVYMRGTYGQRLRLLQGLMDTDGSIDARDGIAEFTSTNKALASAVHELACSLGEKPTMREGRATLDGVDCGAKWRVCWTPLLPVCQLPRKAARIKQGRRLTTQARRYIVACELVDSVPTKCIEVDSADHLFLAGRAFIPTHNSYWLRWHPIYMLLRYNAQGIKNVSAALFCETYPELQDRHVNKIANEFPSWLGELGSTQRAGLGFYLKPKWGGGVLLLRNLDAPDKYKSAEFGWIGIDEITRIPKRTVDIVRGSLRWPGIERPQFCAATNPDGKHHEWVRQLWIEKNFSGEGFDELAPLADEFAFVPAKPGDNPHLSQSYWDDLLTAPRDLREAWLEGNWYSKAFGVVYDEFSADNIEEIAPDFSRPFELAFDDGYIDPRVVLFIQRSGTTINVFDEQWQAKTLDDVSVKDVLTKCATWQGVALPDEWQAMKLPAASDWLLASGARLPEIAIGGSESVQLMRRFREANIVARGGTHEIVEGIKVVRRLIRDGNGYSALKVSAKCKNLIGELTQGYRYPDNARRDSEKPEDASNHGCDAIRCWCFMRAK